MLENNLENAENISLGFAIVCEICGKSISRLEYERHLKSHKEKRVEVCKICFKAFTNISNFKYHLAHHGSDRPWLCNECPKNYKTKIDLLQHQRVHDKARDPFRCEICGQLFRTRSNFNTHLRTHSVKGPQTCTICDKLFVNLRSHVQMVHHQVRQHICTICSKAFGKKSGLDRHIITVHEKMRCWACDLCDKSFGEKAQLLRHRKTHFKPAFQEPDPDQITEDQEVIEREKKCMKCGICKKIVNSRAALKRHKILVHEKRKNLLCDFCPRFFGEKSNLMRHILKSHRKEANLDIKIEPSEDTVEALDQNEVFPCGSCNKILTTNWGLQAHEDICRLNQQKKLNKTFDDNDEYERVDDAEVDEGDEEDDEEEEEEIEIPDMDRVEQVFLVSGNETIEQLEIKQEPDENLTDTFDPGTDVPDIEIKEEPEDDIETKVEPLDVEITVERLLKEEDEIEENEAKELEDRDWDELGHESDSVESVPDASKPTVTFLKRYKCKICNSTFKEKRYFQSHYRTVHGKKKVLQCNVADCDETFVYRAQRLRHLRQKHPEIYEESDQENPAEPQDEVKPEPVECELCNSSFNSQKSLDSHIKHEHDENEEEKDRTCEICSKIFKKTRYLLLHIQAVHSDQSFSCDKCSKTFSFKRSLDRHIRGVHEQIRDFKCEEDGCEKSFCNSYELKQHTIGTHSSGDKSDRTCKICSKVFKKVKYMEIHCASIHNTEPQFNCPICQRGFSFQRSMERHVRAIHEDRRDFKCTAEGCEKAFRSRYDLNEHHNNIHALVKKQRPIESVTCDICEKVCSTRKVLYSHKKMVHEGVRWGMKFECKLCKEIFESKYKKHKHWGQVHRNGHIKMRTCLLCNSDFQLFTDFKQHLETHVGFFICLICGHYFVDESSLFLHQESHRKIEEELRQYVCDVCSHRLSTKAQLLIHMRKHFAGDHYMCDVCGKSYKFIAPFLHHKMGHENRFDFPCRYCEKKFRVSRDRMLHERTHTGERPYKCATEGCAKSFAHKANYLSHLKTHETRAYDCKTCGLHHVSAAKLRLHEDNEHPEERPYRCHCQKTFKAPHSLEHHKQKCNGLVNEDKTSKFANYFQS